jgi:hypothetical protein
MVLLDSSQIEKKVNNQYKKIKSYVEFDEQELVIDPNGPGNSEFQIKVHVSCRNTEQYFGGKQGTFFMWETRWQALLRAGDGGDEWTEPEVPRTGGGEPEMPHPGKDAWKKQKKYKYVEAYNYDASTGVAKDRLSLDNKGYSPKEEALNVGYIINVQTP